RAVSRSLSGSSECDVLDTTNILISLGQIHRRICLRCGRGSGRLTKLLERFRSFLLPNPGFFAVCYRYIYFVMSLYFGNRFALSSENIALKTMNFRFVPAAATCANFGQYPLDQSQSRLQLAAGDQRTRKQIVSELHPDECFGCR